MCIFLKFWVRGRPRKLFEFWIMSTSNDRVYYAVGRGKNIGIYDSWKDCKAQTEGFCNAKYRKFYSLEDAEEFVNFWKNYSSPGKESNESKDSISSVLYQKGSSANKKVNIVEADKETSTKEENHRRQASDHNSNLNVSSHTSSAVTTTNYDQNAISKKKEKSKSKEIVESMKTSSGTHQDWSKLFNCPGSQNTMLDDYSSLFSDSKPFATSTQKNVVKEESIDFRNEMEYPQSCKETSKVSDEIRTCLNKLECAFNIVTVHNDAESTELKHLLKTITRKICTNTNSNINPQREQEGNVDLKVCEDVKMVDNVQHVGLQPPKEQELVSHCTSPRMTCSYLQCSSTHSVSCKGKTTQKDVDVMALNLRLDSFEKRFDACLKEVGGIASEISHLLSDIKELKEALKLISHSGSASSPRKGRDGLMQTTLSFNSSSLNKASVRSFAPQNDASSSKEPEKKRGRTLKRKLSRSDSFSEDSINTLLNSLKPETVDFSTFTVDKDDFVEVYTDGSSLANGRAEAKAGIGIWFGDDHPLNVAEPVVGPATNITAEIQAARVAIQLAIRAGVTKLKILTDSEFIINCATKWIPKWKTNGWILRAGGPVKNRKELEKLDFYASQIIIQWEKVPAHSKIKGNETADRLANEGAARYGR